MKKSMSVFHRLVAFILVLTMCAGMLGTTSLAEEATGRVLTCGFEEHTHTDACYTHELVCGKEQTEGRAHTNACYTTTSELTCGLEESEGHIYSDECYTTASELTCGLEETESHEHTDECYEEVLTCELPEHTHTDACYATVVEDDPDTGVGPEATESPVPEETEIPAPSTEPTAESTVASTEEPEAEPTQTAAVTEEPETTPEPIESTAPSEEPVNSKAPAGDHPNQDGPGIFDDPSMDPVCNCTIHCTDEAPNTDCPVCSINHKLCEGAICSCETQCTKENHSDTCPVCSAEGADFANCTGAPQCICIVKCTEGHCDETCPVCSAEGFNPADCAGPKCICDTQCTEENRNEDCPVCGAGESNWMYCSGSVCTCEVNCGEECTNDCPVCSMAANPAAVCKGSEKAHLFLAAAEEATALEMLDLESLEEIKSKVAAALALYEDLNEAEKLIEAVATAVKPLQELSEKYESLVAVVLDADGNIVIGKDGNPRIYSSFIEAWRWTEDKQTVKLLADTTLTTTVYFNGRGANSSYKEKYKYNNPKYTGYQAPKSWTNTIDLNGHSLTYAKNSQTTLFKIGNGNTLKIEGPGKFLCNYSQPNGSLVWFAVGETYYSDVNLKAGHLIISGDIDFTNVNTGVNSKKVQHISLSCGGFDITGESKLEYFNVITTSSSYLPRKGEISRPASELIITQAPSSNETGLTLNSHFDRIALSHSISNSFDDISVNTYATENFSVGSLSFTPSPNTTTSNKLYQNPNEESDDIVIIQNVSEEQIGNIDWSFSGGKLTWQKYNGGDNKNYAHLVTLEYKNNKYFLHKTALKPEIYLDPLNGNNSQSGLTDTDPVQTLEQAQKLAEEKGYSRIVLMSTIKVSDNETWSGNKYDGNYYLSINRYTGNDAFKDEMVVVQSGAKLTLHNIILDGGTPPDTSSESQFASSKSIVRVQSGGTLVISDGAVLQNNKNTNLKLQTRNDGNSVVDLSAVAGGAVNNHGIMIMTGGTITGCSATFGGGIYNEGALWMTGGTITANEAYPYAPSVTRYADDRYRDGGGVMNSTKNAVMYFIGGTISGNSAKNGGGISVGTGYFSNFSAAKLYMMPIYEMAERSIISESDVPDELAINPLASGLGLEDAGPVIDGNTAVENGGGIMVASGIRQDGGGSEAHITIGTISNNEASGNTVRGSHKYNYPGGGIYVNGQLGAISGKLFLENAEIAYNTAPGSGGAIATCPSSNVKIYLTNGGVMHDNISKQGSTVSIASGYFVNTSHSGYPDIALSAFMLGGGSYDWEGERIRSSGDVPTIERHKLTVNEYGNVSVEYNFYGTTRFYTDVSLNGEKANDVRNGVALAKVHIINNHATNDSGGGIGANGDIQIGTTDAVLRLEKKVGGADAASHSDVEVTFTIRVPATIKSAEMMRNGIRCPDLVFTNGVATFTMRADDVVLLWLPEGTQYTVTETDPQNANHVSVEYTDTASTVTNKDLTLQEEKSVSGTMLGSGVPTSVVFTNTYDTIQIQIQKNWVDGDTSARPKSLVFRLYIKEGEELIDTGKYIIMRPDDWENGKVMTFEDLPAEHEYVVKEDKVPGYAADIKIEPITTTSVTYDPVTGQNYSVQQVLGYKWSFTNSAVTKITVTKNWNDNGLKQFRPAKVVFDLYRNDELYASYTMEPDAYGNWPTGPVEVEAFSNLPTAYYDYSLKKAVPYTYTVKEQIIDGYDVTVQTVDIVGASASLGFGGVGQVVGKNWSFTNTPETIQLEVTKEWHDFDDKDSRPDEITFELYRDDDLLETYVMKPDSDGNWPVKTFENLQKYHYESGSSVEFEYKIVEKPVKGYTSKSRVVEIKKTFTSTDKFGNATNTVEHLGYHWIFTNTPDTTNIEVQKVWNDSEVQYNENGRPDKIVFILLRDGEPTGQMYEMTPDEEGNWPTEPIVAFTNLPKTHYVGGEQKIYTYTVQEEPVEGYTVAVEKQAVTESTYDRTGMENCSIVYDRYVFTNTPDTIKIVITKEWNDFDDVASRPAKLVFTLLRDGKKLKDYDMEPDSDGKWFIEIENLPKYHYESGKAVEYEYTIDEVSVPGYTSKSRVVEITKTFTSTDKFGNTTNTVEHLGYHWIFTNTPDTTNIEVQKVWNDSEVQYNENGRPDKIVFILLRDGEPTGLMYEITPDEEGNWPTEPVPAFLNLPKAHYVDGELTPYTYTVEEEAVEGYTVKTEKQTVTESTFDMVTGMVNGSIVYDRYVFTNTPDTIKLQITKKWEDNGDLESRPAKLIFTLLRHDKPASEDEKPGEDENLGDIELVPNTDGIWPVVPVGPLPKYHYVSGKAVEYEYVIVEKTITGYTTKVEHPAITETTANFDRTTGVYTTYSVLLGYNWIFTNTPEMTKVTVTKAWDESSEKGNLPAELTFALYRDDNTTPYATKVLVPNEDGTWPVLVFDNLCRYYFDSDGTQHEHVYKVVELPVTGYTSTSTQTLATSKTTDPETGETKETVEHNWTFTNTPDFTKVVITKKWVDESDPSKRPASITFKLKQDGAEYKQGTLNRSADGTWPQLVFEDLPRYYYTTDASGKRVVQEHKYTVEEISVEGYDTVSTSKFVSISKYSRVTNKMEQTTEYQWTFTNTLTPPSPTPTPTTEPTPTPTTEPTPAPTPAPTPVTPPQEDNQPPEENDTPNEPQNPNEPDTPEENPNQDIPNRDVPQEDAPNVPNEPNVPNPQENNPNQDLPNQDTPLEDNPGQPDTPYEEPGTDLPDDDVPQSDAPPHTGETIMNIIWFTIMVVSGAGMVITLFFKKREEAR